VAISLLVNPERFW